MASRGQPERDYCRYFQLSPGIYSGNSALGWEQQAWVCTQHWKFLISKMSIIFLLHRKSQQLAPMPSPQQGAACLRLKCRSLKHCPPPYLCPCCLLLLASFLRFLPVNHQCCHMLAKLDYQLRKMWPTHHHPLFITDSRFVYWTLKWLLALRIQHTTLMNWASGLCAVFSMTGA